MPGLSGQQRLENTLKQFGILASIASPTEEQTALAKLFQSNVHVVQGIVEKCVYKIRYKKCLAIFKEIFSLMNFFIEIMYIRYFSCVTKFVYMA